MHNQGARFARPMAPHCTFKDNRGTGFFWDRGVHDGPPRDLCRPWHGPSSGRAGGNSLDRTVEGAGPPGGIGWLSQQPEEFQDEVFRRAVPVKYRAGEVIYRLGDPVGGIYGFVSGAVSSRASRRPRRHPNHARADSGRLDRRGVVPEPRAAPASSCRPRSTPPPSTCRSSRWTRWPARDPMATRRIHADPDDQSRPGAEGVLRPPGSRRAPSHRARPASRGGAGAGPDSAGAGRARDPLEHVAQDGQCRAQRFAEKGWVKSAYRSITSPT